MPELESPWSVDHLVRILSSFTDYEKMAAFHSGAVRCDLSTMQRLSARLGDPHRDRPCIHIAGSKGKGSTALMTAALLESAGFSTGVFTSPHLVDLRERIAVSGASLPDAPLLAAAEEVLGCLRRDASLEPTFFEFITMTAMTAFRDAAVDFAIYETGLGGRLDSTNVVIPEVSVITSIEMEHVKRLGPAITDIAAEKAGIIKQNVPVVAFLPEGGAARRVVEAAAHARGARLVAPGAGLEIEEEAGLCRIRVLDAGPFEIEPPRPAALQTGNAACAVAVLLLLGKGGFEKAGYGPIHPLMADLEGTFAGLRLPGRFEVKGRAPRIVLDGAHSPESLRVTVDEALRLAGGGRVVVLFCLARDKDAAACLEAVRRPSVETIFTPYRSSRSSSPDALLAAAGGQGCIIDSMEEGLAVARRTAGRDGLVLVTGSFYGAGEASALLDGEDLIG